MSTPTLRENDRVLLYGVEHIVFDTQATKCVWLRTLDDKNIMSVDRSLVTPIAPPEPPKPAYFEGTIEVGMRYFKSSSDNDGNGWNSNAAFEVYLCNEVIRVERATGWETVFPVPDQLAPQIGGEFILGDDQILVFGGEEYLRYPSLLLAGKDACLTEHLVRVESADGVALWERDA